METSLILIQIAVHCISIRDGYTSSCRDVLLCLVNLTHLPKIIVSVQSYGLKFHTDRTGEFTLFTVATPSDGRIGPGAVRYNMQKHSPCRSLCWCNLFILNPVYQARWPLGFACVNKSYLSLLSVTISFERVFAFIYLKFLFILSN